MKRFAFFATTAALAGSLLGAGTAARAVSTMSLVPVSPVYGFYQAGDLITVAVVLNLGTSSFSTFSVPTAVGYLNSQFDDPSTNTFGTGDPTGYGADPNARFAGPTAAGGTANYVLWDVNSPDHNTDTNSQIAGETVKSAQVVPGHSNRTIGTGADKSTLAVPAGTYTLATFVCAVAASYSLNRYGSNPLTLYLPTPNGFANTSLNADGAFANGISTYLINGKSPFGVPIAETLTFPQNSYVTFNNFVPAPPSLLIAALGTLPMIGVLRRRRAAK